MHGCDAGMQRLRRRQQGAVIHVARREDLAERGGHGKIAVLRIVARHITQQRRPHMPVSIDQARHDDEAARVDQLGSGSGEISTNVDDRAVVEMHIAAGNISLAGLHGHDIAAADENVSTRGQTGHGWRDHGRCAPTKRTACGYCGKERPSMKMKRRGHGFASWRWKRSPIL